MTVLCHVEHMSPGVAHQHSPCGERSSNTGAAAWGSKNGSQSNGAVLGWLQLIFQSFSPWQDYDKARVKRNVLGFFFWVGGGKYLTYNVVLVSGVQQRDSAIHINTYSFHLGFFIYRILNIVSVIYSQTLSFMYLIYNSLYLLIPNP